MIPDDEVVGVVAELEGCKAAQLRYVLPGTTPEQIERLVTERRLVEVRYVLPASPHTKSFLFPTHTEILANDGQAAPAARRVPVVPQGD